MTHNPPAIIFATSTLDRTRVVALIVDGPNKGWLCFKHPDGQWVSLREATTADYQLAALVAWKNLARLAAIEALTLPFALDDSFASNELMARITFASVSVIGAKDVPASETPSNSVPSVSDLRASVLK
jgi:hypothetical protein